MPNLLTRYDNGSFEAALITWNAEFISGNSLEQIRDTTEFFAGAASLRLKTAVSIPTYRPYKLPVRFSFPATDGESYEATLRIKCDSTIPDDVIFYLMPRYKIGNYGRITPITAAQAKTGWQELKVGFIAETGGGTDSNFTLAIVNGSDLFHVAFPDFKDDFPQSIEGVYANNVVLNNSLVYLDAAYVDVHVIEPEELPADDRPNLYHVENIFMLRIGAKIYRIDEPIKWDSINLGVTFDESARAFKFEFTDKDVLLEFDNQAGRKLLMAEYKARGVDGDASLKFGEVSTDGDIAILYEADINFDPNSYSQGQYTVKANCERRSFGEKIRAYFDTKTDIFTKTSLSGNTLAPLVPETLYVHPRQLTYAAEFIYNYNVAASQYDLYDNATTYDIDDRVRSLTGKIYESLANGNLNHEPTTSPAWWKLSVDFPAVLEDEIIPGSGSDPHYKTTVPPFKATTNNIVDLNEPTPPEGSLIYAGITLPAGVAKRSFSIEVQASFKVDLGNNSQFPLVGFAIYKQGNISGGGDGSNPLYPTLTEGYVRNDESMYIIDLNGNVEHTAYMNVIMEHVIDLYADEALFIKAFIFTPDDTQFIVDNFQWTNIDSHYLKIRERTVYAPSLVKALRLHEMVNRQFETITDRPNPLKSNFLGRIDLGYAANGCASNHYVLNGLMLRNFLNKPFISSAKDNFNALNGLFCMGMSIERDNLGGEWVRLEPVEFFFRNILLLKLTTISKYFRRPADKYIFNEIEGQFSKFPQDNQADSIEDFHTKMSYTTPLKRFKNKLTVAISWILSGYYTEYTRREAFEINPTNSYETDNDTFCISGTAPSTTLAEGVGIVWDAATNTATINKVVPVVVGDVITTSGGSSNNGSFTVLEVEIPFIFDKTILSLSESVANATTTSDISIGVTRAYAKRDEDFDLVDGVSFEHSVYNLEHHWKRILLRWAKIFQSGWAMFINPVGLAINNYQIKFNTGIGNTKAGTRLKSSVSCKYGDGKNLSRYDMGNDGVTQMDKPLFGKDYLDFETPMSWSTFNYITKAFEARNPDGKDYGYLQLTNPDGEIENGFVISMKFKPTNQTCKVTLIEKFNG